MKGLDQKIADSLQLPKILKRRKYRELKAAVAAADEIFSSFDGMLDTVLRNHGCSEKSKAQLHQDILVLLETNFKRNGYFVEIGAASGVDLSNTYLLEKSFGWNGILVEPAVIWHDRLRDERTSTVVHDCVWSTSGAELEFNMTDVPELSTIDSFSSSDSHEKSRKSGGKIKVNTISLNDLLIKCNAPKDIDYLSIDTEGSEYEILKAFDFKSYNIQVITCEHNYTENRERIHTLLTRNEYIRKYPGLSRWDDWYVKAGSA